MQIAGIEFPDDCPTDCPGHDDSFNQGGLCARCPLFNCMESTDEEGEPFRLLEPDDYRKDWAKEWKRWFNAGMTGQPALHF